MATVRIPEKKSTVTKFDEVREFLAGMQIDYERWPTKESSPSDTSAERILEAYSPEINRLNERGGYTTADVIDIHSTTPGLDEMLAKFNIEHWHDEDEVRYILDGRGIFHIHPANGPVFAIEVGPGDLIRVPRGTLHWFDLCGERRIRAIRLFQDRAGWTPHYTNSGVDQAYDPVCFGPAYIQPQALAK